MVFHKNIIELAKQNENFRQVVSTGKHSQIVLMSLLPREDIGEEVHDAVDQILVFVNAGVKHNFRNTGSTPLKIYTVYSPVNHPADRIQKTKAEAMKEEY